MIEYLSPEEQFLGQEYDRIMKDYKQRLLDLNSREAVEFVELGLKELTIQSDVYSIAAIMLKCLIGKTPT